MAPGGSSSRQKNCNACVKSKRRCDKQMPTCGNCIKKKCPCLYGGRSDMQSYSNSASVSMGIESIASPGSTTYGGGFTLSDNGLSATFDTSIGLPDATLQIDSTLESLLNSMTGNGFGDTYGLSNLLGQDAHIASAPTSKALSLPDYSRMSVVCDDYAPWQLADHSTRVAYAVNVFKNFHTTFARNKSTMYMHGQLYVHNTPLWILQAFSISVLYTNQTAATRGFVLRILHDNVNHLIHTASGIAFTPQEKLARVHALIVYQTIRMFDGDISLGQQAENDLPLMEAWNDELGKMRDNLDDLAELDTTALRNKQPESWERWMFAESVRRTHVACLALKTFWDLLKYRDEDTGLGKWEYFHRWILSKHLWDATNSFDFYRAWKEKPMWIISAFDFDEFLRTGKGDDMDDFALVFLTLSFGINEVKTFCYETSRRLLT
ncbi:hypothetical protein F4781DRAFT_436786 [Annulohypoxylon bovei var. microspora]|nr:hypothetical protein F4781DRAFT_436786 [Annulohypoxylon bovei var. microspora]